jgi:lipoprotein-releasing system permease protein
VASRLKVSIGDQVRLILTEGTRFTPLAGCRPSVSFTVSGIFGVGADVDSQVALIALGDAQRMLRLPADRWAASASGWMIPSPPTRW